MSELIVVSFPESTAAGDAYDHVRTLGDAGVVDVDGLALVTVDAQGSTHVRTPSHAGAQAAATGAGRSALFGALIGLLFFVPFLGLVVGGAVGALFAGLDRTGIDAGFRDRVRALVADGRSAVVVFTAQGDDGAYDDVAERFGGTVVRTTLSAEDEHHLAHDLGGAR